MRMQSGYPRMLGERPAPGMRSSTAEGVHVKSDIGSVALIVLLALGMVGCGGSSESSSNASAEPSGTVPIPTGPTGPTGGDPTLSTLQAQLAACPNDLILSKDVPCFVGTY